MTNASVKAKVLETLKWLKQNGSEKARDEMLPRYGIQAPKAFGVSMADLKALGKKLGRSHELAAALWETGWYEARMVTSFVDEPERVTAAQMDRWCADFDNWAICDTLCFHLFDRTPHAFDKVSKWAKAVEEFRKRAAFALLACLALHDKRADDGLFLTRLPLVERAADDDRNFVKKGVSWALRAIGERNDALYAAATALARRLAASDAPAARWVGKDVIRQLGRPATIKRLAAKSRAAAGR